jgi:hypothetical protein
MMMDWVSRHHHFNHLKAALTRAHLMQMVAGLFSPDDLLSGSCTGSSLIIAVIIVGDKNRKQKRQLKISNFFVKEKKRQRQLKIEHFFVKKARP